MQVDLSSIATPVITKKRVYKKSKAEAERPTEGGKSLSSYPVKEKKPPTEKQLAAREKLKVARLAKVEQVKAEKAKIDEEVRLKEEEIARKKKEIAEKRRLKREEKKKLEPLKPVVQSEPGKTGVVDDLGPTISQTLQNIQPKVIEATGNDQGCYYPPAPPNTPVQLSLPNGDNYTSTVLHPSRVEFRCGNENHKVDLETIQEEPSTPPSKAKTSNPPNAPKREYKQRFRSYPFGKSAPVAPRFR